MPRNHQPDGLLAQKSSELLRVDSTKIKEINRGLRRSINDENSFPYACDPLRKLSPEQQVECLLLRLEGKTILDLAITGDSFVLSDLLDFYKPDMFPQYFTGTVFTEDFFDSMIAELSKIKYNFDWENNFDALLKYAPTDAARNRLILTKAEVHLRVANVRLDKRHSRNSCLRNITKAIENLLNINLNPKDYITLAKCYGFYGHLLMEMGDRHGAIEKFHLAQNTLREIPKQNDSEVAETVERLVKVYQQAVSTPAPCSSDDMQIKKRTNYFFNSVHADEYSGEDISDIRSVCSFETTDFSL